MEENRKDECNTWTVWWQTAHKPQRNLQLVLIIPVNIFGYSHDEVGFPLHQVQRFSTMWLTDENAQFTLRTYIITCCKKQEKGSQVVQTSKKIFHKHTDCSHNSDWEVSIWFLLFFGQNKTFFMFIDWNHWGRTKTLTFPDDVQNGHFVLIFGCVSMKFFQSHFVDCGRGCRLSADVLHCLLTHTHSGSPKSVLAVWETSQDFSMRCSGSTNPLACTPHVSTCTKGIQTQHDK